MNGARIAAAGMGRSPLTRGRRLDHVPLEAREGSIPAHAGETGNALEPWRNPRVDPRSRGGDHGPYFKMWVVCGRSPLTRGRRKGAPGRLSGIGSIPAHAGETWRTRWQGEKGRVDPRSRGGDCGAALFLSSGGGRSPLTRGRPSELLAAFGGAGSIPAHAGETSTTSTMGTESTVDPRSRGGDPAASRRAGKVRGRSPLTRGRQLLQLGSKCRQGSIPAHAGETQRGLTTKVQPWVDPRSRGGDCWRAWLRCWLGGRSPLTRGRRLRWTGEGRLRRSIPAHAGETNGFGGTEPRFTVDPRSRGGDVRVTIGIPQLSGRSPLTRGRRALLRRAGAQRRSIPAHAGETDIEVGPRQPGEVDPRSRGGDRRPAPGHHHARGRSPLTRGRRGVGQHLGNPAGSIPAHAGETPMRFSPRSHNEVDPRSRGGDTRGFRPRGARSGRSPLTRGRLPAICEASPSARSIPAHAGETKRCALVQRKNEVDPRSRGGDPLGGPNVAPSAGRSPLTRGRRHYVNLPERAIGSIPAHAGETAPARSR